MVFEDGVLKILRGVMRMGISGGRDTKSPLSMHTHRGKATCRHSENAALQAWEGALAKCKSANTLTLDSQAPEQQEMNAYCLSHPVCGIVL